MKGGQLTVGPHFVADADVQGLLFDCDGTLVDSMPLFTHSWYEVCPKFGMAMSEEAFYMFAGMPLDAIVRSLHRDQLGGEATEKFVAEFLAAKKQSHGGVEATLGAPAPIECVVRLAREAVHRGVPIAIATSGLREHVEVHLKAAGLDDLFNEDKRNIVYAADVYPNGKPAPDIYLEAAKRIGVPASACRAFEDGESGLQSGYAAGCHVIDVAAMDGYPSCAGLRRAKQIAAKERTWV